MSTATDNFNPPWMQTAAPLRVDKGSLYRGSDSDDPSKAEMIAPVFAQHRYGREDILAMMPKSTRPPDGLRKCQFFVEEGQLPIILSSLNETELRLQQNINSSKALSLLTHQERLAINGTGNGTGGATQPASPWVTAGASKTAKPGSRWSALTSNDSPSGGSGYVKAGMSRGGGTSASGRGGGTAARGGRSGGFDLNRAGVRTRLRSTSGDDDPQKPPIEIERQRSKDIVIERSRPTVQEVRSRYTNDEDDPQRAQLEAERRLVEQTAKEAMEALRIQESSRVREHHDFDEEKLMQSLFNPPSPPLQSEMWFYLAPTNDEHGPYEAPQMVIWYKSGFFRDDLRCRRNSDQHFTTLGELIQKNGRENPFVTPKPVVSIPPDNAWRNPPNDYYDAQRAMLEEKRRIEERQEALRREEQERLERERRVREKELDLQRKHEELNRIAIEREEEIERKRRQLLEYEERAHQDAERRIAEQRARDAMEARRIQEQYERDHQELVEQKRKAEELFAMKQKMQAEEAQRIRDQAIMEARRQAAEAEKKKREKEAQENLHREKMERERKQQEELMMRAEHLKQLADAQRRREAEEAAAKAAHAASRVAAAAKAPWTASQTAKDKPHVLQTQRSLLEIQLEEEKALEEKRRKDQELFELQRKQTASKSSGPWTGTIITSTVVPKPVWDNSATQSPVSARSNPLFNNNAAWPAIPTPPPKKEQPKLVSQSPKQKAETSKQDDSHQQFQKWAIKGINNLNKTVDASVDPDMFFGFIKSITDPLDVEDYFITYFGEKDEVKEFQKKFLEKRIALRSKQKKDDKDDLSAAQAAVNVPNQAASSKKKKGKGQVKTVDLTVLGFKAGGDPNRINVGEIDTAPPVSNKKKR